MEKSLKANESSIEAEIEGNWSLPDELPLVDEGDDEESLRLYFEIAMAVMDEDEEPIEIIFVDDKICKLKAGLTKDISAKHGSKDTADEHILSLTKDKLDVYLGRSEINGN